MQPTRHILVTSALPYANGSPHLGHLLEAVRSVTRWRGGVPEEVSPAQLREDPLRPRRGHRTSLRA